MILNSLGKITVTKKIILVLCKDLEFYFFSEEKFQFWFKNFAARGIPWKRLHISVKSDNCPQGFEINNSRCSCEQSIYRLYSSADSDACDINSGQIKRPNNDWIVPIFENSSYSGFKWASNCPIIFCDEGNKANTVWLNLSSDKNKKCRENRMGVLCGTCTMNYSLLLGSLDCALCEDRYISLLLVFMAAGIVLVALLLLLHIDVSTGTINGLILIC